MQEQDRRDLTAAKIACFFVCLALDFCLGWGIAKNVFGFGWESVAPAMAAQMFCMGLYIGWGPLRVLRNHRKGGK